MATKSLTSKTSLTIRGQMLVVFVMARPLRVAGQAKQSHGTKATITIGHQKSAKPRFITLL